MNNKSILQMWVLAFCLLQDFFPLVIQFSNSDHLERFLIPLGLWSCKCLIGSQHIMKSIIKVGMHMKSRSKSCLVIASMNLCSACCWYHPQCKWGFLYILPRLSNSLWKWSHLPGVWAAEPGSPPGLCDVSASFLSQILHVTRGRRSEVNLRPLIDLK